MRGTITQQINQYNPFSTRIGVENMNEVPRYIKTIFGTINRETKRYHADREPEHFFKKYQGFGISKSEIHTMRKHGVKEITIRYHGTKENTIYKIQLAKLTNMKTHNNKGDLQIIIPIKEMQIIGKEEKQCKKQEETWKNY